MAYKPKARKIMGRRLPVSEFVKEMPKGEVQIQDWSHLGVKTVKVIEIDFEDIFIDDIENNTTKVLTHTADEIEALKRDFSVGVCTSAFLPAVTKFESELIEGEKAFKYKLQYGFGRCEALLGLNQKRWLFILLEGNDDALEDVKAQENEPPPQRRNTEDDMFHFISKKITSGKLKRTQKAVESKLQKVYPTRSQQIRTKVLNRIISTHSGIKSQYYTYTSKPRIQQWYRNYNSNDLVTSNNYDSVRDMYGRTVACKYLYRIVHQALDTYKKTGKYTYFTVHLKVPSKNTTHAMMIKEVVQSYVDIVSNLRNIGANVIPFVFEGILPYDISQNPKHLIVPAEVRRLKKLTGFNESEYQAVQKSRTGLFKATP